MNSLIVFLLAGCLFAICYLVFRFSGSILHRIINRRKDDDHNDVYPYSTGVPFFACFG